MTLTGRLTWGILEGAGPFPELLRLLAAEKQEGGSSIIAQWGHHQLRDTGTKRCLH